MANLPYSNNSGEGSHIGYLNDGRNKRSFIALKEVTDLGLELFSLGSVQDYLALDLETKRCSYSLLSCWGLFPYE